MTSEAVTDTKRHQMLSRLRAQLGRTAGAEVAPHPVTKPVTPKQSRVGGAARVSTFLKRARAVDATTARVADPEAVVTEIARYLSSLGSGNRGVTCSQQQIIQDLPWDLAPEITRDTGPLDRARADHAISVTGALCGITETGSLMVASGPDHPVTLNFLPADHIVVLRAEDVVSSYEQAWAKFDQQRDAGAPWPRAVHWITGPSRSADIALKPELGAHGPLRLHVIVLDPSQS